MRAPTGRFSSVFQNQRPPPAETNPAHVFPAAVLISTDRHIPLLPVPRFLISPSLGLGSCCFRDGGLDEPTPREVLASIVLEVTEEDCVQRNAVLTREIRDHALGGSVELRRDDHQTMRFVECLPWLTAETLRKRLLEPTLR